jgi:hypothetical protein
LWSCRSIQLWKYLRKSSRSVALFLAVFDFPLDWSGPC